MQVTGNHGVERRLAELTAREREVLALLPSGVTNRLLAKKLGISERTVRYHLTSITRKLEVGSRVEAAIIAHGWQARTARQPG